MKNIEIPTGYRVYDMTKPELKFLVRTNDDDEYFQITAVRLKVE